MSQSNYVSPQLGDRVKDPITGFSRIITVLAYWLHGCVRAGVQPEEVKELPYKHRN